jgi:hypothetical protein
MQAGLACDRQLVVSFVMCDVSNHMHLMVTHAIGDVLPHVGHHHPCVATISPHYRV